MYEFLPEYLLSILLDISLGVKLGKSLMAFTLGVTGSDLSQPACVGLDRLWTYTCSLLQWFTWFYPFECGSICTVLRVLVRNTKGNQSPFHLFLLKKQQTDDELFHSIGISVVFFSWNQNELYKNISLRTSFLGWMLKIGSVCQWN